MAIINLVALAQYTKTIYANIFLCLFVAKSTKDSLLGTVSTNFSIV